MATEYCIEPQQAHKHEKFMREYLLANSDTVRLTETYDVVTEFFKDGKLIKNTGRNREEEEKAISENFLSGLLGLTIPHDRKYVPEARKEEKFAAALKALAPSLIRKEQIERREYKNGIIVLGQRERAYHFYKASAAVKGLFKEETLFWNEPDFSEKFYGFEDPTFYHKGKMLAMVITHETMVILYDEACRKAFEKHEIETIKYERPEDAAGQG